MATSGLRGRVAIVTGASRRISIGAAVCRALAADGADVFFTHWSTFDRTLPWGADEDGPAKLQSELQGMGVRCDSLEIDLSKLDAPKRILDEVELRLGQPSILVNNAAYSTRDGYEALDAETLDAHYAVNMRGAFLLTVEFARRFSGKSGGRIINLTSGQSLGPMPGELKRELLPRFPQGRTGLPEDAARLIAFLASDEASWITGQVIHSRGGFQ
jgi:3-oxoacyl-[acyl-carrier protein] reductase